MMEENQRDLEKARNPEEILELLKMHKQLKEDEIRYTAELGTVIFK
jgi:hypothetical protein